MMRLASRELKLHWYRTKKYCKHTGIQRDVNTKCDTEQLNHQPIVAKIMPHDGLFKLPGQPIIEEKLPFVQHVVKYMEKTTYMEDVRRAQLKVLDIKKQLLKTGDEKRSITKELENVRNDLNHIYKDMKIHRTKETYLNLARQEIELCELEKSYSDMYKSLDADEQKLFTEFSAAINNSYEKEKLHTNFIKVISIIGTITSSIVALILSIIFHAFQYSKHQDVNPISHDVLKSINNRLGSVEEALTTRNQTETTESWGSYFYRHTRWIYGWAIRSK